MKKHGRALPIFIISAFFRSLLQTAHAPYASVHLGYANLETGSKWSCPRRSGSGINIACGEVSRHWIERYMGPKNRRQSEGFESNNKPCDIISYWRRKRCSANQQYREIQSALRPAPGVHTAASSVKQGRSCASR